MRKETKAEWNESGFFSGAENGSAWIRAAPLKKQFLYGRLPRVAHAFEVNLEKKRADPGLFSGHPFQGF